jgi:hypothetical protein
MPRRRRTKQPPRMALPASELESKIMAMLSGDKDCAKLKGVDFVYVGSIGREANWFARTIPPQVTETCRRAFVAALAKVRKEFDLSPSQPSLLSEGTKDSTERLGDPTECRERAAYCAERAATAVSPVASEKFAHMAKVWLHLAIQLEEQWALLDQWRVKPATGE